MAIIMGAPEVHFGTEVHRMVVHCILKVFANQVREFPAIVHLFEHEPKVRLNVRQCLYTRKKTTDGSRRLD